MRYTWKWWGLVVVHNMIVHPCLPVADLLAVLPFKRGQRLAHLLFEAHDRTAPEGAG